jgi:hypothetical protein
MSIQFAENESLRRNGRETTTILIALYEHDGLILLPLKLRPSWNLTFHQYAQEVDRKVSDIWDFDPDDKVTSNSEQTSNQRR